MKRLIAWGAVLVTLTVLIVSQCILLGTSDTAYEAWLRSKIAAATRSLVALDSNDFENPVVIDQSYVIEDDLIAMSSKLIYGPGEPIVLYSLSKFPGSVTVYSVTDSEKNELSKAAIPANKTSEWTTVNSQAGFDLSVFARQVVDAGARNGWLQVEVQVGSVTRYIPIFRQGPVTAAQTLFVEGTNTLMAYNTANSLRSSYANPMNLQGKFSRPAAYPMDYRIASPTGGDAEAVKCNDHLVNADMALKSALAANKVVFDQTTDAGLASAPVPSNYKVLVFGSHAEYWSSEMRTRVEEFIARGGSVLFLGGNNAWRFVEKSSAGFDIFWGNGAQTKAQNSFIDEILGTYWDMRGYNTYAPMKATTQASDFAAGVSSDISFGKTLLLPRCASEISGISGYETDKLRPTSSKGFVRLAHGENPWDGGADVVTRSMPAGGTVLNFSSTGTWQGIIDPTFNSLLNAFFAKALKD